MDKSLDDIIKAKPSTRRSGRRGSGRAQVLGKPVTTPVTRARAAATKAAPVKAAGAATPAVPTSADKIIVSNLPIDVNEAQIRELFASTVGPTKEVNLSYDASGRSKGVAAVSFSKKGDATKAFQQYHNRLIDGKRPMKIEIVVDPSRPLPLASRVAPAAVANGTTPTAARPAAAAAGRRGGRRRGGGGGGGGAKRGERTPKSAADLDAEMEDYTAANAPAAPAAAAPATA